MFSQLFRSKDQKDFSKRLITFLLFIMLLTFLLRFLWNQALVPHINILMPVDSLWNTFLLALGISMFR